MKTLCLSILFSIFAVLLPCLAHAATISRPVNSLGLVGYWPLNEGTSTIAGDFSGSGDKGTISGSPSWVTGKRGSALRFDGVDDWVNVNQPAVQTSPNVFTISGWINPDNQTSWFLSPQSAGVDQSLEYDATNKRITVRITESADVNNRSISSSNGSVPLNTWSFFTITIDDEEIKLYINGVLNTSSTEVIPIANWSGNWRIGQRSNNQWFKGMLDDLRVYNRALSAGEIAALYTAGSVQANRSHTSVANGLVGWWTLDGTDLSSTTAYDRSGSGNNGVMTNAPQPVIGKIGQALRFDGATTRVSPGNAASLQISQGTIVAWIKTSNAGSSYRGIVQKSSAYGLYLLNNVFGVYDNGAATFRSTGVALNDGAWHQVAEVLDSGVANGSLLYVDGQFVTAVTHTITSQGSGVIIGRGQGSDTQTFTGDIDDARIYNRKLSAEEIKQIYNEVAGTKINVNTGNNSSLTDGLVGYWSFNGSDVTDKIYDRSGQAGDGYFFGSASTHATSTAKTIGKVGQALQFNGTTQYVAMPDSAALSGGTGKNISVFLWEKADTLSGTNASDFDPFITKYLSASFKDWGLGTINNKLFFGYENSNNWDSATGINQTAGTLTTGAWYHVGFTISNGTAVVLYINGVAVNSFTLPSAIPDTAQEVEVGKSGYLGGFFDGTIDEVRVYDRALSADEIKRLYNLGT